jgi:hypothetical protein
LLDRLPVLTQVVRPPSELGGGGDTLPRALSPQNPEAALLERVSQQLDVLLEARLRSAVAPALARAADGLVRELRAQLAQDLREIVAAALEREGAPPKPG